MRLKPGGKMSKGGRIEWQAAPMKAMARTRLRCARAFLACLSILGSFNAGFALAGEQQSGIETAFRVRHVAEGAAYLEGGRAAGLEEGQRLTVKRAHQPQSADGRTPPWMQPDPNSANEGVIAELEVIAVASSSTVCEIKSAVDVIQPGDMAHFSQADVQKILTLHALREEKKYPQVITFTEEDPLEEEVREYVPRPPLPEINRARGRLGFEYNATHEIGESGLNSSQLGFVLRMDMTRLAGSYWNFSGYHRGRINSRGTGTGQETLTDLINRTYHLSLTYNNPESRWVAGMGRLYLPWASSLNTIDGGYFGSRLGSTVTIGLFGGTAPDPTSWNYAPDRQMAGALINFERGSFESFRFMSTIGMALSRIQWHPERQFGFLESGIFYKRNVSVFHNMEADLLEESLPESSWTERLVASRSYLTVRVQPHRVISFDFSHNYFRDIPTFDMRLVGTGLVDKLLFQGVSGGFRLELPYRLGLYASVGKSDKTGDAKSSWNQMYGISMGRILNTGVRADLRYSKFDSAFGRGSYRSLTLAREISEVLRFDIQTGEQDFVSPLTSQSRARWINSNADVFLGIHYFLGAGLTLYRGDAQGYNQWYLNLGYRF